jgi:hypothetical protein
MPLQCSHPKPTYTIDAQDRLIDVNEAYVRSLPSGHGISNPSQLIGRSLWDFISGAVPKQLWRVLQRRVRALGAPVFVPMRVDLPDQRRLVDVELHALGNDDIRHVQQMIWCEARSAIALLDPNYPRDERTVVRCAWCARVQVRLGLWMEIEGAQRALELEAGPSLPKVQETACTACKQSILQLFPARAA